MSGHDVPAGDRDCFYGNCAEVIQALESRIRELEKQVEEGRVTNGEHVIHLSSSLTAQLHVWLQRPNGSLSLGRRATFNAVEYGGLLLRTYPFSYEKGDR